MNSEKSQKKFFILLLSVAVSLFLIAMITSSKAVAFFLIAIVLSFNFYYSLKPRKFFVFKHNALKYFFQEMGRLDIYRNIQLTCYFVVLAMGIWGLFCW